MKITSVEQIQKIIAEKIPEGLVVPEHDENGHHYRHLPTNLLLDSVTTKSSGILDNPHLKKWSARLAVDYFAEKVSIDSTLLEFGKVEQLKEASVMVHNDIFLEAGGIGTQGHGVVERYLLDWISLGEKPKKEITDYIEGEDSRLWAISRSADLFIKDFYAIPVASEQFVASVKHKFAGTLDGLMFVVFAKNNCTTHDGRHFFVSRSTTNPFKVSCFHCDYNATQEFALIDWKTSNSIDKAEYAMQVSAYAEALKEMLGFIPKVILIVRLDKKQAKYEVRRVVNQKSAFRAFLHIAHVYDWLNSDDEKLKTATPKEIINLI